MDNKTPSNRSPANRIFFSSEEHRLRSGWRVLGQLVLFAIFAAGAMFYLFPLLPEGNAGLLLEEFIRLLAITIPVFLARRFLDRRSFTSLGLVRNTQAARDLFAGFLIGGFVISLLFLVEWALGWLHFEGFAWSVQPLPEVIGSVLVMLVVFLMTGFAEELHARGYWLQNLEEGLNLGWAVVLTSILFSLSHIGNPRFSWMAFLGLFVGGFDLAYGYIRTRQLWLPIGLHLGWNFFEGTVLGFQVSGMEDMPRLILHSVSGPELWTGGEFGPEAGLLMLPAVVLNILLIWGYTRKRDIHKGKVS